MKLNYLQFLSPKTNEMIEMIGTISMGLGIIGVILNNRKMTICFYFWLVSNGLSAWIHLSGGVYSLLVRDTIFFVLAIEGIIKWRKKN